MRLNGYETSDDAPRRGAVGGGELAMTMRERLVELALSYVGCGVTSDEERYVTLLMTPGDPPCMERYYALPTTSGCALTVLALWREMGLEHSLIHGIYKPGRAMEWIVKIAQDYNAWVPNYQRGGRIPELGDAVIAGSSGHEHAYTVTDVTRPPGVACQLHSVDGGQKDKAKLQQMIGEHDRVWNLGPHGEVTDRTIGDPAEPGVGVNRPLLGFVNVGLLPFPEPSEAMTL